METRGHWRGTGGDALLAILLACVMAAAWSVRDWQALSALHLPDTDDVMRLQQIRDWLGGQAFADLSQHRLGAAPGLAMHWSRLADLVPGAIITWLTPLTGRHAAEIAAVIAWPTMLFAAALFLVSSIARRLAIGSGARTALVVAAIGYPVTSIFLPGRIDHHGFQIVLLLVVVRALLATPSRLAGAVAGIAACLSIVIGLETAPFIAVAGGVMWLGWIAGQRGADQRLLGFGVTAGLALVVAGAVFAPLQWSYPGCDGFTRTAWRGAEMAACAAMLLALTSRLAEGPAARIGASIAIGTVAAVALWPIARACASPYGQVDPLLARLWLGNVGEAQSILDAPIAVSFGYLGLLAAGIVASLWRLLRTNERGWAVLLAFQITSLALGCVQMRGAYAGAILAAPALAAVIAVARRRGSLPLVGAWLASAGMLYPIAAQAFPQAQAGAAASVASGPCASPDTMARLRALPRSTVLAPMDFGAYAIAATPHRLIAAPYHRNNAGNAAMYRFFLGNEAAAARIAEAWRIDVVVLCPGSFSELGQAMTERPGSMLRRLRQGDRPGWLIPIGDAHGGAAIFTVKRRLSSRPVPD